MNKARRQLTDAEQPSGYVVETPACDDKGVRIGTMRHWTPNKETAIAEAAKVAERTWREVPFAEMPANAQAEMRAHRAGDATAHAGDATAHHRA